MKFIDGFNISLNFHVRETRHLGNIGHTINLFKLADNMVDLSYFSFDADAGRYSKTKLDGICCGNNLNELFVNQFFQPVPDGRFRNTDGFSNFRNGDRTPSDLKSSNIRRNLFMDDDIPFFDSLKENFSFFFIKYLAREYPCSFNLAS